MKPLPHEVAVMKKSEPDVESTSQQAAELAGVDSRTIRRWLEAGHITGRQLPGGPTMPYLVSKQSLLRFLGSQADQPGR